MSYILFFDTVNLFKTGKILKPINSSQDSIPFYSTFKNLRFLKWSLLISNYEHIFEH